MHNAGCPESSLRWGQPFAGGYAFKQQIEFISNPACRFRDNRERIRSCVYLKLKHGRSGDEVRPGWRVN